ncbi:NAD(P)/FAD-dependent oxidoreductase [Geofilum rubicundum]|uniref:Dehydrogenase n=1 Tax=Geofilum rubicundum JCM 15548 TaxID=1236989 RepID=A0A0E9M393_9BACT|nr:NAD(P)/FAD-dependent oxidoreductase [Geofilum rubicundum]GAO31640.1 dehydrogenase [Geofilum rubicundum JCM 15548]
MNVAIIGGGAAGFFAAITAKEKYPAHRVVVFEKTGKLLSKVKISGGGRCNVTNACGDMDEFCEAYPRGGKRLKKLFHAFSNQATMQWFEARGVPLVVQDDHCVFPVSQNAQSIVDCLLNEAHRLGVEIKTNAGVCSLESAGSAWNLRFQEGDGPTEVFDGVLVATGGSPKMEGLKWLGDLGHRIENPVPSLFTFNLPDKALTQLMGVVVDNVLVRIPGTNYSARGPLLVTHWGLSGPAILKLSSFAARHLNEKAYQLNVLVNWLGEKKNEGVKADLQAIAGAHPQKRMSNARPLELPERLWLFLLAKSGISADKVWQEVGKKALNKLVDVLINDVYEVKGQSTFREEFVTCGGVSLSDVDLKTMESKVCKNLYFAGEVLDIDALTGGFNLQAAWATGFVAGAAIGGS